MTEETNKKRNPGWVVIIRIVCINRITAPFLFPFLILTLSMLLLRCNKAEPIIRECEVPMVPFRVTATNQYDPFQYSHIVLWSGYPLITSVFDTDPRDGEELPDSTILQAGDILISVDGCDAREGRSLDMDNGRKQQKVALVLWSPADTRRKGIKEIVIQRQGKMYSLTGPAFDKAEPMDRAPVVNFQPATEIPDLAGAWVSERRDNKVILIERIFEIYTMTVRDIPLGRALLFGEVRAQCSEDGFCRIRFHDDQDAEFSFHIRNNEMQIIRPLDFGDWTEWDELSLRRGELFQSPGE
ncbi:MAG: hypothetical protein CMN76_01715 [Spirochaetaceae bacterium]|nr:hypothetical protein [Spirochaetaceae bacterium]MBU41907.1 hypothetical protein [Spirochaetaceae bacterium]|tara:strand:+ start:4299 stop:5192 length:894 start_codon:yes stop_codon:yes gene_type:complete